jgi:hypothetical protein
MSSDRLQHSGKSTNTAKRCIFCVYSTVHSFVYVWCKSYICYAQRSKTLIERKKRPQRVVALQKLPQREMSWKWTVYTFRNLFTKKTRNVGLIKNSGEAHLFLQELLERHLELHLIFCGRYLHFLSMQYLLEWQLTSDVIIEADGRDSELEGTSCVSMKLSAAVNSLRAYSRSSRPSWSVRRAQPAKKVVSCV